VALLAVTKEEEPTV